jgi:hypothetical protein
MGPRDGAAMQRVWERAGRGVCDGYLMEGRIIRLWSGLTSLWLHKAGAQPDGVCKQAPGGRQWTQRIHGDGQEAGAIGRGRRGVVWCVVYGESEEKEDADQQKRPRRVVTLWAGVGGEAAMAAARLCRLFFLVADLPREADSCSPYLPLPRYTDLIFGPALCPLPNHGMIILPCLPCLLHPLASTFSRRPHGSTVCCLLTPPSLSPPWRHGPTIQSLIRRTPHLITTLAQPYPLPSSPVCLCIASHRDVP